MDQPPPGVAQGGSLMSGLTNREGSVAGLVAFRFL